jgi:flagellar basal body-associated protein FliL
MDPKKKKKYIILIIVCLVLSAAILIWSSQSGSVADVNDNTPITTGPSTVSSNPIAPVPISPSGSSQRIFNTPPVFPSNDKFQDEVLDTEEYRVLKPYTLLDITGQLGRPDPFSNY